ncbi:MAG: flagellar hook-associated protein FlgK [Eubacteriales bacterium]|nr:flagellar hook-associated protein FlgK [Eubacteriales bacterium]
MIPSFVPFQTARRALVASMTAITVTGNNIANANTENYTRQNVDLNSISGNDYVKQFTTGKDTPGQGVEVASISQSRDAFLDSRFREQSGEASRYDTFLSGLEETLSVIDEATTDGLMQSITDLASNLQKYSQMPTSSDLALVVRTSAESLTAVLNAYSEQITNVRKQAVSDLSQVVVDNTFNSTVESIADLNKAIREEEISGETPNELYDRRNALIDKLSGLANIKVITTSEQITEDKTIPNISISIYDPKSGIDIPLIDKASYNTISVEESTDGKGTVSIIMSSSFGTNDGKDITDSFSGGSIKGYVDLINGEGSYADAAAGENIASGTLYYLQALDTFATNFAETFNSLNENPAGTAKDLFTGGTGATEITARNLQISEEWRDSATYITTTTTSTSGSGENLLRMVNALSDKVTFYADPTDPTSEVLFEGSFSQYTSALVAELSLQVELNGNFSATANTVLNTLNDSKENISGVAINDEGVNLIVYQKAYEAASRYFTALDEAMDTMINRMGRVGL